MPAHIHLFDMLEPEALQGLPATALVEEMVRVLRMESRVAEYLQSVIEALRQQPAE